ncbi:MAG: uroporphyrinogen-III C-methyltransferase [Chloroflexi bacterium]|nr:uroporphyrinogen-III C-methyltransferase [Chloroflexota bacterium]MCL5075366.1 uroporphyrinogen-III C-methyltransferase [Chloroflexota bacterium]
MGKVYLVGGGPGDPGLITVKGICCLQEADVVIYDHLIDRQLLTEAKPTAELIYVGKAASKHTLPQEEINALLIQKAREGKVVVRLKGGDPFVFGRGGEEAEVLAEAGIAFEVVPGVTSAVAVPAYAGIPLTHREYSSSFAVITGHEDLRKLTSCLAWDKLATGVDTLVVLMGMGNLSFIVGRLLECGRTSQTPVTLIRHGSGPEQEVLEGTLGEIVAKAKERGFSPPVVMVVGEVVRLREKLRWFDNRPLFGQRVLVTRSREQASSLVEMLRELGAKVIEAPTIEIQPISDHSVLDKAITHLEDYDWLVFTSQNSVNLFFSRLQTLGLDSRELKGVKLCAIGPATAKALGRYGLYPDYMPSEYVSERVVAGLAERGISGQRILLPRAEGARDLLLTELTRLGAVVDEVTIYRTVPPATDRAYVRKLFREGGIDIVTFTSSSTVRHLAMMLGEDITRLEATTVACIGPITAQTATELGIRVDVVAEEHTIPGLVKALVQYRDRLGTGFKEDRHP